MEAGGWRSSTRELVRILLVLAGSLSAIALLALSWAWLVAVRSDIAPAGPTCTWEADVGSGSAGVGREEIHWGMGPEKVCVPEGPNAGKRPSGDLDSVGLLLGGWCAAAFAGPAAVALLYAWSQRRVSRSLRRDVDVTADGPAKGRKA
jgi:hypothetical protein